MDNLVNVQDRWFRELLNKSKPIIRGDFRLRFTLDLVTTPLHPDNRYLVIGLRGFLDVGGSTSILS